MQRRLFKQTDQTLLGTKDIPVLSDLFLVGILEPLKHLFRSHMPPQLVQIGIFRLLDSKPLGNGDGQGQEPGNFMFG